VTGELLVSCVCLRKERLWGIFIMQRTHADSGIITRGAINGAYIDPMTSEIRIQMSELNFADLVVKFAVVSEIDTRKLN